MKLFCNKCSNIFSVEQGDTPNVTCPSCSAEIPRPEKSLAPGVVVGDFRIEKSLSKGGMGEVFLATQISLDRPVALKILQQEFVNDRDYVASLFREARAAAKINHPNIVQAYAVGSDGGNYYFAMELVRGDTLKNILRKEGALPVEKAAKVVCDIANALDVAWREQQLVHQDIKPDNIMLDVNGFAKLADLGLAKSVSVKEESDDSSDEVLGTPQYISPEQLTGVPTDVRSDIYSLGATFYHIVTGKLPYRASDLEELAQMHNAGNLVPPKEIKPDLPDELNRIIVKMMARDINKRYQSAADLVRDLEAFLVSGGKSPVQVKLNSPGKISLPGAAQSAPKLITPNAVRPVQAPIPVKPVVQKTVVPKPVAPPKPAVPQPVVPKPVVPKPVSPQPVVPKPAVPPAPVPHNPALPPNPTLSPNPVSAPVQPLPQQSQEKKGKSVVVKVVIIAGVILVSLILLAAIAVGVLFFLEKNGTMSPKVTPYVNKFILRKAPAVNESSAPVETKAVEVKPEIPENLPVSSSTLENFEVTGRAEVIGAFNELIKWREQNSDSSGDAEFLKKVDAAWMMLGNPVTELEHKLLQRLKKMFSAADESRCAEFRRKLRQEHIEKLAAAESAYIEQKKREAAAAEEQKRRQLETEKQARESARIEKENQEKDRVRLTEITNNCNKLLRDCILSMREALISGNDATFVENVASAKTFLAATVAFNSKETQVIRQFKHSIDALNGEKKKLGVIFKQIQAINEDKQILVDVKEKKLLLVAAKPGILVCRDVVNYSDTDVEYSSITGIARKRLIIALTMNLKNNKYAEFYFDLFHKKPSDDKLVPAGFWRQVWPVVKSAF